jgi:hypothetical protein
MTSTKKPDKQHNDPLIDEVRARRKRLVRKHGGLRGWVAHLQREQQKHPDKVVPARSHAPHS